MAERAALGASSLYAGIFGPAKTAGRDEEVQKDVQEDTEQVANDSPAGKPREEKKVAPASVGVTSGRSTALRFAPRKKAERTRTTKSAIHLLPAFGGAQDECDPSVKPDASNTDAPLTSTSDLPAPAESPSAVVDTLRPVSLVPESAPVPQRLTPPPMRLPDEELEKDRARALSAAEERGDLLQEDVDVDDVNEFYVKNPRRVCPWLTQKHRRKRPVPASALALNLDADYDPAIPNDYTQYKALVKDQRRRRAAWQGWTDGEEEDDREYTHRFRQFAPPPSYTSTTGTGALQGGSSSAAEAPYRPILPEPSHLGTDPSCAAGHPRPPGPPPVRPCPPGPPPARPGAPGPPPPPPPSLLHAKEVVEQKRHEASMIASRFAAQSGSPSPEPAHRPDPARFAERLMEKYGYREGEGLGAEGNKGMTRPLEARLAKRGSARGTIVNRNRDEAALAKAKFGDPSEVIVLDSALDLTSDVPPELPQEMGT